MEMPQRRWILKNKLQKSNWSLYDRLQQEQNDQMIITLKGQKEMNYTQCLV